MRRCRENPKIPPKNVDPIFGVRIEFLFQMIKIIIGHTCQSFNSALYNLICYLANIKYQTPKLQKIKVPSRRAGGTGPGAS
jgi:hypothetical protein